MADRPEKPRLIDAQRARSFALEVASRPRPTGNVYPLARWALWLESELTARTAGPVGFPLSAEFADCIVLDTDGLEQAARNIAAYLAARLVDENAKLYAREVIAAARRDIATRRLLEEEGSPLAFIAGILEHGEPLCDHPGCVGCPKARTALEALARQVGRARTAETEEQAAEREDRLARAIVVALGEDRDSAKPDLSFMGQYRVVRAALAKARGGEGG